MSKLTKIIFSVFYIVFCLIIFSCTKGIEIGAEQEDYFVKYFGGSQTDSACDIHSTSDGGYVLVGNMVSAGVPSAFFIKTDKYGNSNAYSPLFLTNRKISSAKSICETSDGKFIICGYISEVTTKKDILFRVVENDGNVSFAKEYGTFENDEGNCIIELTDGNYLIGGYTGVGKGKKDARVICLNKSGEIVWSNTFGGVNDDVCYDLKEMDSYILLTGSTESFQYNELKRSVFLVKIDKSSGNPLDAIWYGGSGNEEGVKAVTDTENNIYILANSFTENGKSGIYLFKLGSDFHTPLWEKYISSGNDERGYDISYSNQRLIVTGTSVNESNANLLLSVFDLNGNLINYPVNVLPALGNQFGIAGIVGAGNRIVIAGNNSIETFSKIALIKTEIPR